MVNARIDRMENEKRMNDNSHKKRDELMNELYDTRYRDSSMQADGFHSGWDACEEHRIKPFMKSFDILYQEWNHGDSNECFQTYFNRRRRELDAN